MDVEGAVRQKIEEKKILTEEIKNFIGLFLEKFKQVTFKIENETLIIICDENAEKAKIKDSLMKLEEKNASCNEQGFIIPFKVINTAFTQKFFEIYDNSQSRAEEKEIKAEVGNSPSSAFFKPTTPAMQLEEVFNEIKSYKLEICRSGSSLLEALDKPYLRCIEAKHKGGITFRIFNQIYMQGEYREKVFQALEKNQSIKYLNIPIGEGYDPENRGATLVANLLSKNTSILYLDLEGSSLTDKGLALIAESLTTNKTLRVLNLNMNPLSPHGIHSFCEKIKGNSSLLKVHIKKLRPANYHFLEKPTSGDFLKDLDSFQERLPYNVSDDILKILPGYGLDVSKFVEEYEADLQSLSNKIDCVVS